jgi:type I restriction-modification system DNA methylase subunit
MDTLERYPDPKAVETEFARMMYLLLLWLEADMTDALGEIYMELDIGNKYTGQFFTPFHVSEMCARIALEDYLKNYKGDLIKLNEPSVGGGGMVIAAAKILKEAGINYQKKLKVVAQDLDWKGVYMSHLQFSMLGIQAYIYQGDTLSDPFTDIRHVEPERVMATPAIMGVLL